MKKITIMLVSLLSLMLLTACAEIPEGVSQQFHNKAYEVFVELDDDTMELELADRDDLANIQLMASMATSDVEKQFADSLTAMLDLTDEVVAGDVESLKEYLTLRTQAMNLMNMSDNGSLETFNVSAFEFAEEDGY